MRGYAELEMFDQVELGLWRCADGRTTALPHVGWAYRPANVRDDVQESVVDRLAARMTEVAL